VINELQNSDVIQLDMNQLSKFFRREQVWIILFFKPNQPEQEFQFNILKELASKFYGIFSVAVVDCQSEEELC